VRQAKDEQKSGKTVTLPDPAEWYEASRQPSSAGIYRRRLETKAGNEAIRFAYWDRKNWHKGKKDISSLVLPLPVSNRVHTGTVSSICASFTQIAWYLLRGSVSLSALLASVTLGKLDFLATKLPSGSNHFRKDWKPAWPLIYTRLPQTKSKSWS